MKTSKTRVERRFILVMRKTRVQELIERFNTWQQAQFYLQHQQLDAKDYWLEHETYQGALTALERVLQPLGRFQRLERGLLPNYQFQTDDVIVVVGQDGLVANTLKYLTGQAVIAVNPDPQRWDGKLLPFRVTDVAQVVARTLAREVDYKRISFAEARSNDGQRLLAVNDVFIGPKTHTSARYQLHWNGHTETQSSSGVIVSTGFGSSGWLQSVVAGACGVCQQNQHPLASGFAWDEPRLQFSVREPFPSKTSGTQWVYGAITPDTPLSLVSQMPENGVIFSDGIEADYLQFNAGTVVTIQVAEQQGALVC